jgi:hypothetical protein
MGLRPPRRFVLLHGAARIWRNLETTLTQEPIEPERRRSQRPAGPHLPVTDQVLTRHVEEGDIAP